MPPFTEKEYFIWLDELLKHGKTVQVPVRGMSMFPFLMKDDIIVVEPVKYEELEPGQVLIFERGERWVAHRLIKAQGGICHTQGDGNRRRDNPFPFRDVKGVVTGIVSSRWMLARYSHGRIGKILIRTGAVTGPVFYFFGNISYKVLVMLRSVFNK